MRKDLEYVQSVIQADDQKYNAKGNDAQWRKHMGQLDLIKHSNRHYIIIVKGSQGFPTVFKIKISNSI